MIKQLYKNPTFSVIIDNIESSSYQQETGIRQGCPLSSYLFIIVMHALFKDVEQYMDVHNTGRWNPNNSLNQIENAPFLSVLYAGDSIEPSLRIGLKERVQYGVNVGS